MQGRQKTFCFTQIDQLNLLPETFQPDSAFSDAVKNTDSISHGNQLKEIVIQVSPAVAPYFQRRKLLPNQTQICQLDNGGLLLAFFYLVVIGTALTFSLYLKGAQMIGGPKASILSCAEPLSSALLSVVLLGVAFTLPDWLGTLLIVSSVVLISMDSRRRVQTSA